MPARMPIHKSYDNLHLLLLESHLEVILGLRACAYACGYGYMYEHVHRHRLSARPAQMHARICVEASARTHLFAWEHVRARTHVHVCACVLEFRGPSSP